jgi:acetyltransferase-like isoleucine patch superfamily enzyme
VPWTNKNKDFARFSIGDWTYGSPIIREWEQPTKLTIGKYCSIADGVTIFLGGEHRTDWLTTFPFTELLQVPQKTPTIGVSKGDVTIGHDVWIGSGATILSGVNIGTGTVIGARSVVTKTVQPYSIVAGNPARHIRFRFPEHIISQMLNIGWWNWPDEQVLAAAPILLSDRIDEFISQYGTTT